jgi:hypothetical protein
MGSAVRCIGLAVLALGLSPSVANAAATVNFEFGIITIVGDPDPDAVRIMQQGNLQIITRTGGNLTNPDNHCVDNGTDVRCMDATSIAIDLGGGNDNLGTTGVTLPISVAGGGGNDVLAGGSGRDVLAGGPGNDTLNGGRGVDDYFGETGDDIVEARDGAAERISCGADNDLANNDFVDIIAECERGIDGDRDGFSTAVDCNDASPTSFPGAREIFENGVDENCDGRDNVNLDRDGDGFARPLDCNDRNRRIRPNRPEIRGNRVDENCDRRALPFAQFAAVVSNRWLVAGTHTRLLTLIVRNAPRGTRVRLTCSGDGCPFRRARRRTIRRDLAPVRLHKGFRRARLRAGTRLRLRLSRAQTVTRTYTFTVKHLALPENRTMCRAPGARKPRPC